VLVSGGGDYKMIVDFLIKEEKLEFEKSKH